MSLESAFARIMRGNSVSTRQANLPFSAQDLLRRDLTRIQNALTFDSDHHPDGLAAVVWKWESVDAADALSPENWPKGFYGEPYGSGAANAFFLEQVPENHVMFPPRGIMRAANRVMTPDAGEIELTGRIRSDRYLLKDGVSVADPIHAFERYLASVKRAIETNVVRANGSLQQNYAKLAPSIAVSLVGFGDAALRLAEEQTTPERAAEYASAVMDSLLLSGLANTSHVRESLSHALELSLASSYAPAGAELVTR